MGIYRRWKVSRLRPASHPDRPHLSSARGRTRASNFIIISLALVSTALADVPPKNSSRIEIAVTKLGFEPGSVTVPAKTPVTLVFTRKTDQTCAKAVILTFDDGKKIDRELPLDKPVEIAVTFPNAGTLGYACSMNMSKGEIVVR